MKLAGQCHRHPELAASDLVLWQPNQNQRRRGRPRGVKEGCGKSYNTRAAYSDGRQDCLENHVTDYLRATI